MFYDGACPICAREMALMKHLDRKQRLKLCDFSAPGYDAGSTGLDPARLGAVIHAQWDDGMLITGVKSSAPSGRRSDWDAGPPEPPLLIDPLSSEAIRGSPETGSG